MAEMLSKPKEQVKERRDPILDASRLRGAEFEQLIYTIIPERGITREDMERPGFWSSVAMKLRPWTQLNICAEDGTYYAIGLVLACDRAWAKVKILSWHDLTTSDVAMTEAVGSEKFEVNHTPNRRWHVIRKTDRQVMKDQCQTKAEAELWVTDYVKTVNV